MALGMRWEFQGLTQGQYDAVMHEVDLVNQPPPGLIFHCAGPSDDGWQAVEVWESREAWQRYFDQRFGPTIQQYMRQGQQMSQELFAVYSVYPSQHASSP